MIFMAVLPCLIQKKREVIYTKTLAGELTALGYQKYYLLTQDSKLLFSSSLDMCSPRSSCMKGVPLSAKAALAQELQKTTNWALECPVRTIPQ